MRSELSKCRLGGFDQFAARQKKLQSLINEAENLSDSTKPNNWTNQLNAFNNGKTEDHKTAYLTRFLYDNENLVHAIAHFGHGKHILRIIRTTTKMNFEFLVVPLKGFASTTSDNNVNSANPTNSSPVTQAASALRGSVQAVQDAYVKHSTSHSSLVSSVGEDSGLGQISPVQQGKKTIKIC